MRNSDALETVADVLRNGGLAVYPTETLYAVGCRADNARAVKAVSELKARPQAKPLPVLIGSMEGLENVCEPVGPLTRKLMESFWPGPLSILVQGIGTLAEGTGDSRGRTSVRWTDHPVAAALSTMVGAPLVATSANVSGYPPVSLPAELDHRILDGVDAAFLEIPYPAGGSASTVVDVVNEETVRILRHGAVSQSALEAAGFPLSGVPLS